jgi:hypothetical protein
MKQLQLGDRPVRLFRFVWIGKSGPCLKVFTSIEAFSGYVHYIRKTIGFNAVEFRTPVLAIGVLS